MRSLTHIEPLRCPGCDRLGRPGEIDLAAVGEGEAVTVHCACGGTIKVENPRDQFILSENDLCCLIGASNHSEHGELGMAPGSQAKIRFSRPIGAISSINFAPNGPVVVKEHFVQPEEMSVISCAWAGPAGPGVVQVDWSVQGLVDVDSLPVWYVLFYSAVSLGVKKLHKPAVLDYAASFEAFLGDFLRAHLERQFGPAMADYTLDRTWRVDDRCKDLLRLVTGRRLTDAADVYRDWQENVRRPRDLLMHGGLRPMDEGDALKARRATYQAVRWIQDLVGEPHPLGPLRWRGMVGRSRVEAGSTSLTVKFPKPVDQLGA